MEEMLGRHYEGDSMQTRNKQQCYDAIFKAVYKGYSRNFDFTTYVTIHQQVHQDLTRLGEPVPENKKVHDFLNGIVDPQCTNIKLSVISNPIYMNDFHQAANFCASAIDMVTKNSSSQRQISNMNTVNGRSNRGRASGRRGAHRGGYIGSGHGRNPNENTRGGRGYRGRSRGWGRGRWNENNHETNDQSISRNYSREEWQNLSQPERNRIYCARNRLETARTMAAMIREQNDNGNDDISTLTPSVQNLGAINQQTGSGDNGNQ